MVAPDQAEKGKEERGLQARVTSPLTHLKAVCGGKRKQMEREKGEAMFRDQIKTEGFVTF